LSLRTLLNEELRLLNSSPLGFFGPYRVSMTKVVSFWLIYPRLVVWRLPGFPFVLLGSFGGRKNLSSLGFLNPSGAYPHSEPSISIPHHYSAAQPATLLSVFFSSAHEERQALSSGSANSRQSPLIAFLHLQRAGRENRFSHPSGLFRPENAPEFLPSGF
jgi:hypothetical protein